MCGKFFLAQTTQQKKKKKNKGRRFLRGLISALDVHLCVKSSKLAWEKEASTSSCVGSAVLQLPRIPWFLFLLLPISSLSCDLQVISIPKGGLWWYLEQCFSIVNMCTDDQRIFQHADYLCSSMCMSVHPCVYASMCVWECLWGMAMYMYVHVCVCMYVGMYGGKMKTSNVLLHHSLLNPLR